MTSHLILAAGVGSRLMPYTANTPKAMVKLLGDHILSYQLKASSALGITNIGIVTGHKREEFKDLGLREFYNKKYRSTNMVESLMIGSQFLLEAADDVIISYGDIVYEKRNLNQLIKTDADVAVMVDASWLDLWSKRMEDPLSDAESLKLGHNQSIIELGKKPLNLDEINGQYTGLFKIKKSKINELLHFYACLNKQAEYDGQPFERMYMTSFIQLLIDQKWDVRASIVNNGWLEVDTVADLNLYHKLHDTGELSDLWCAQK